MKVATLLGLLIPGMLAHALEAYAASLSAGPKRVEIGQPYQLSSETVFRGRCPGCSETSIPAMTNAMLRFKLVTAGEEMFITMAGDAQFVSPTTGMLHFVAIEPLRPEQIAPYREQCADIMLTGADVTFDLEEIRS